MAKKINKTDAEMLGDQLETSQTDSENAAGEKPTVENPSNTPDFPQTDSESVESTHESISDGSPEAENNEIPQTDEDTARLKAEDAPVDGSNSGDDSFPQTGNELDDFPPEGSSEARQGLENNTDSQTETAGDALLPEGAAGLSSQPRETVDSQTDLESGMNSDSHEHDPGSELVPPDGSQTDLDKTQDEADPEMAPPRAPRKRRTKSQSDGDKPDNSNQQPDASQTDSDSASKPTRRRARRSEPVVPIDDRRSVETHDDKVKNDLLDLVESLKGKKILTGTIQGVERSADNSDISFAVIYHGEFKVIIPAEQLVEPPSDFRDRLPGDVMHYLVTKRLGAEVDYIVKGVDQKTGIAAASRLEAMALKRREYYFGTDRDGNYQLYEGVSAEARIVSVIRAGIFIDLFGLETYIPLRELSYQRWIDASLYFQPGQRVLVRILSVNRSDRANLQVTASVKQAGENPYEKALRKYSVGNRYVGTVSMVDVNGVFVSLDGGIDCLCSYPKRGRPPRGSRVTVRILGINHESNRIWGAITHMTTPR